MAKGKRGRKPNPNAKRRQTTREGRRTGFDPVDRGTDELRKRKKLAHGRTDLPLDPSAVLLAREVLDRAQFDRIGEIGDLMRRLAKAWGIGQADAGGVWAALLAAASRPTRFVPAMTTPLGAEHHRRRLDRLLNRLDGSRDLVLALAEHRTVPIVIRAWERRLSPHDAVALDRLRQALDRLPPPHRTE